MSAKPSKPAPGDYTDHQKSEVVRFVHAYNADHGKGGQLAASKHFNVPPLTIAAWLKKSLADYEASITLKSSIAPEVTTDQPKDPRWDQVREVSDQLRSVGRLFLRGQVKLGMMLAALKKDFGKHGGDRKSGKYQVPDSGTWSKKVKDETGYSRQSCDEFIRLYEATKNKLKTAKKLNLPAPVKKDAIALFRTENPLTLTDEQWTLVDQVIGSLTTGETQASLMQELGLVPKPKAMPKGGGGKKDDDMTAGQLAFHFFEAMTSPLINARTNPDYKKLLYALPLLSTEDQPLSLATLESEARAMLADIEDAKQAAAKPAKGRTINA